MYLKDVRIGDQGIGVRLGLGGGGGFRRIFVRSFLIISL